MKIYFKFVSVLFFASSLFMLSSMQYCMLEELSPHPNPKLTMANADFYMNHEYSDDQTQQKKLSSTFYSMENNFSKEISTLNNQTQHISNNMIDDQTSLFKPKSAKISYINEFYGLSPYYKRYIAYYATDKATGNPLHTHPYENSIDIKKVARKNNDLIKPDSLLNETSYIAEYSYFLHPTLFPYLKSECFYDQHGTATIRTSTTHYTINTLKILSIGAVAYNFYRYLN